MRSLPSATSADGYQPTGILPTSASAPVTPDTPDVVAERSKTATALLSPSATNRRRPSGERESAFGVLPSPVAAGEGSARVVTASPGRVSMASIRSVLPDAPKRVEPSICDSNADGCRATLIRVPVPSIPLVVAGNAETVRPPHAETYSVPSGVTATPYG